MWVPARGPPYYHRPVGGAPRRAQQSRKMSKILFLKKEKNDLQIKSQLAFDSAHRLMSGLLAFFSPMPKEAQRKQRPASSPAVHARFPEPKEARNLKRKGSTLQLRAATEKKKDNRGGAGRGQGRKKGSLGKRKQEAQ